MFKRTIIVLISLVVMLLVIPNISATDNLTEDMICFNDNETPQLIVENESALPVYEKNYLNDSIESNDNIDEPQLSSIENQDLLKAGFSMEAPFPYYIGQHKYVSFTVLDDFEGNLIIEKSGTVFENIKIKDIKDYNYDLANLKSIGKYNVKIIDSDGYVMLTSSFKILKNPTITSVWWDKKGKTHILFAEIESKAGKIKEGIVKFKINGKTYYGNIKNGKAFVKVKLPSKYSKKYKFTGTFMGNSLFDKSSDSFSIPVKGLKKSTTKKKTTKFTVKVPVKLNKKMSKSYGKYKVRVHKYIIDHNSYQEIKVAIKLYKNGKSIKSSSSKYKT